MMDEVNSRLDETAAADMQAKIESAMSSRGDYFKTQADSLTFGGVRRLLEEDMGLEKYALDCHKIYIKQCLLECINGPAEDSKKSADAVEEDASLEENNESIESHQVPTSKKYAKDSNANDEGKMEDSPIMGLMAAHKVVESQDGSTEGNEGQEEALNESRIKKAVRKRASYIKANLEKLSIAEVRRLLEGDLGVEKYALDHFKKFIFEEINELVNASSESAKEAKKKSFKKLPQRKTSKKVSSDESADSSDCESEEGEEDIDEPKKKRSSREKIQNPEGPRKRKKPTDETKVTAKKRIKPSNSILEDKRDAEGGALSEDGNSQSSNEKPAKKREVSTPTYGKRVEHLKFVIKSCGTSVPPSVYKKVKQVPENKREACLIKELEGILTKEGLSPNPSEKEIKEVKRRKERAKELEGIDMSNIVTSSRRRSVTSFLPPPKPKQPVESDGDDDDNSDESGGDNDNEDDEDEEEEEEGGDDDENQSEESDEDKEHSD